MFRILLLGLFSFSFLFSATSNARWVKSKDKNGEKKSTRKRLVKKRTLNNPPVPIGVIYAPGYTYDYQRQDPRFFNGINGPGTYRIRDNRRYRYPDPRYRAMEEPPEVNGEELGLEDAIDNSPYLVEPYDPNQSPRTQFFFGLGFEYTGGRSRSRGSIDLQLGHRFLEFGEIRGGVAFLQDRRTYSGLSLGARAYMPWNISPYVGGGFFLGRHQSCETVPYDEEYDEEICDRYDSTRVYPEIGVLYRASQRFRWLLFMRHHFKLSGDASPEFDPFFGISFQYR